MRRLGSGGCAIITKITVDGFKSLADFEIELGQVNVLIGANGSGKTNILEAIGVLGAAASGRVDDSRLRERGVRLSPARRYQSRLSGMEPRQTVGFGAEWKTDVEHVRYEVELAPPAEAGAWRYADERAIEQGQVTLNRSTAANGALNPDAGWAALKAVELSTESAAWGLLSWLREYALYAPDTPTLRGTKEDQQQRAPLGLSGGGLAEAVGAMKLVAAGQRTEIGRRCANVLAEAMALVDWASDVAVGERSAGLIAPGVPSGRRVLYFEDRFMAAPWRKLGAYECSEGALYILQAAVLAAMVPAPWCLAVDDFDHALNPRLARALVERFCGWVIDNPVPRQVLITTHNPLVLDGLDLTDDRIRLFAVDRTSKGRTVARRVVVDQNLMEKSEGEWPLSRLWVRGEIGGMPRV